MRAQSLIYSQQRTHHFCRHHPTFNAYVTISRHTNTWIHSKSYYWQNTVHETDKSTANPTWGVIFERSKLKARTSLLPRFSEKRSLSFELWASSFWNSIRNCHPKWDRLHILGSTVNHQSTIMILIFTILLIQTYIQINYYYDKNHADSTVITQYVEIELLNNKSTVLCAFCFYFVLDWSGFQTLVTFKSNNQKNTVQTTPIKH